MKADSIEELLQSERSRRGFSPEQRAGLWKGIESSIGPIADPGSPPEKPSPPASAPASNLGDAAKPFASLKIGALIAVAAIGGAGIGAAAHARWGEPRVLVVERAAESAAVPPPSAALVATAAPASAVSAAIAASSLPAAANTNRAAEPRAATSAAPASSAVASAAAPPRDPGLARERHLLDMARTALSRGDTGSALSAVDNHAREFPKSQLAEEREVLAIQALASAGRMTEARRRASAFRMSFPKSALLPIVDESTQ